MIQKQTCGPCQKLAVTCTALMKLRHFKFANTMQSINTTFRCFICSFEAPAANGRHLGSNHQDAGKFVFLEDTYMLKDPNSSRDSSMVICLGSKCSVCSSMCCSSDTCSLFYTKRYCKICAQDNQQHFPPQLVKSAKAIFMTSKA